MFQWNCSRLLAAVATAALSITTIYAGELDPQQKEWIAKYEKQQNVPEPDKQLLNTDAEPDLTKGFQPLFNLSLIHI